MSEGQRAPLVAFLIANCISLIGSSLTAVAIPWFVLQTTGSAGRAGLSGAAAVLPAFAAGIFGGAPIDRIGACICAIVADIVSGISILIVPLLYHTVGLAFWQLLVVVLFSGLLDQPGMTARRALLPELAEHGAVRLERVNSILEGNQNVAIFLGPPLAGILIATIGPSNVLWIDGASSLISATTILLMVPKSIHAAIERSTQGYVQDIREGLQFLWREPVVRSIAVALSLTNLFGAPFFGLLFAIYANERYDDARYLGFMLSASAAGLLIGITIYGAIGFRSSRYRLMLVFLATVTLPYWPLAFSLPFGMLLVLIAVGGLCDGPINPLLVSVRLERIPAELRGRVFAATSAFAQLFPGFSIALTGILVQEIGFRTTVLVLASLSLIVNAIIAVQPVWRQLDDTRPKQASFVTR